MRSTDSADDRVHAGVDVGGRRKGFHVAAIQGGRVLAGPQRLEDVDAVLAWTRDLDPATIAVDSPMTCAPPGEKSRTGERELMKEVCGIRFTPEESKLEGNPYYEWVVCGRELYAALGREGKRRSWEVIEVFPTASWTVWAEPRKGRSRAGWSREALERMHLKGLPTRRLNQDDRDAVAAARTAQLHAAGATRAFGDIVVPRRAG
jgi:predicted nuclease with RNAse H fold